MAHGTLPDSLASSRQSRQRKPWRLLGPIITRTNWRCKIFEQEALLSKRMVFNHPKTWRTYTEMIMSRLNYQKGNALIDKGANKFADQKSILLISKHVIEIQKFWKQIYVAFRADIDGTRVHKRLKKLWLKIWPLQPKKGSTEIPFWNSKSERVLVDCLQSLSGSD